ncbi:MAG: GNAT family N-acetyltransferase [Oligoflexus sp.]
MGEFIIKTSGHNEAEFAETICRQMEESAKARGTGIARRSVDYIRRKMENGDAFVALEASTLNIAGFCYIEKWSHGNYIANSGLIIFPEYRQFGLARRLKEYAFQESRIRFPDAKLFGLTTSSAVMHINSDLGYRPVIYESLTQDHEFWQGCQSCVNYSTLLSKNKKNCFCTAMLFDPARQKKTAAIPSSSEQSDSEKNKEMAL